MKKEFVTFWTSERVDANTKRMPIPRASFFNSNFGELDEIIIPDDISFDQLAVFDGRKTRVTIEIID